MIDQGKLMGNMIELLGGGAEMVQSGINGLEG